MYGLFVMFNMYCNNKGTRWREIDMIGFHYNKLWACKFMRLLTISYICRAPAIDISNRSAI